MVGGRSLKLATVFGIRIGVSTSWFFVLFLLLYLLTERFQETLDRDGSTPFFVALAAALLLFGSILLHELGHALAARREGIGVSGIVLFFFGGVMQMSRDTDSAGAEFRVAAAGPLVTLLIVVVGAGLGALVLGGSGLYDAAVLADNSGVGIVGQLLAWLVSLNAALFIFNLVPAFPLDGGRIARSVVWKVTGDRARATRVSARLGQGFAYVLMGFGLYVLIRGDDLITGIWLIGLGFLLGQSARGAVAQTAFTERLDGVTVADIMDAEPVTIPAQLPAGEAYERYFERYQGWNWFAVVEADGRYVGLAHRAAMQHAALEEDGATPARDLVAPAPTESRVRADAPLEALLASQPLREHGALMAVDAEGRLRGVVTLEQVSRALRARLATG